MMVRVRVEKQFSNLFGKPFIKQFSSLKNYKAVGSA